MEVLNTLSKTLEEIKKINTPNAKTSKFDEDWKSLKQFFQYYSFFHHQMALLVLSIQQILNFFFHELRKFLHYISRFSRPPVPNLLFFPFPSILVSFFMAHNLRFHSFDRIAFYKYLYVDLCQNSTLVQHTRNFCSFLFTRYSTAFQLCAYRQNRENRMAFLSILPPATQKLKLALFKH